MWIANNQQMRELDRQAIEIYGIPSAVLMENAGCAVAQYIMVTYGESISTVFICCGKGNNGGDGMVVARTLHENGFDVKIFLTSPPDQLRDDALLQFTMASQIGITYELFDPLNTSLTDVDLIVDALLGTGISGSVSGLNAECIKAINESHVPVISVDIPSGINGDTGHIEGIAVQATATVSFGLPKLGLFLPPGYNMAGEVEIADISYPIELLEIMTTDYQLIDTDMAYQWLPDRPKESNKGENGKILVVGGSRSMVGAPALVGISALRAGGGLVTLAVPASVQPIIASFYPDLITVPLPDNGTGYLCTEAIDELQSLVGKHDVVLIGPGLSQEPSVGVTLQAFLPTIKCPMVIDADGLNWLAQSPDILSSGAQTILTPHPGEMARLLGSDVATIQSDRVGAVSKAVDKFHQTVVLKGGSTITSAPDSTFYFNANGNSGLATAGTGDVLTGIIGGLLGQKVGSLHAAAVGVYLHSLAGDIASHEIGAIGYTASDLSRFIPKARRAIQEE